MPYVSPIYPTDAPDYTDLREVTDNIDDIIASDHNDLMKELVAVILELGTLPKGSCADVKTRLGISLSDNGSILPMAKFATAPTLPTDAGAAGDIAFDGTYFYLCYTNANWLRQELTTW